MVITRVPAKRVVSGIFSAECPTCRTPQQVRPALATCDHFAGTTQVELQIIAIFKETGSE